MKKLLGIMVLGLLLSSNAYANKNENIKIDLIFCGNGFGAKTVYLKDTFDGSCPPSQPMEITFKEFKKKYGWQINKQLCYQPYEKKSSRVFLTPGGPCKRISKTSIKIKYKGGNYYYYGNKEKEKKKREELADKKKKEEEKIIAEKEKKKPKQSPDDDKIVEASMGSGFFVTRAGHLVTNYHVIEECDAVKTNILGKEIRTDIIAIDKTNDLAIIKAEMKPSKVFPVSNEDVSLMQDVIVAGFPLGKKVSSAIKIHKGSVTALAGFGDNYSNFQTDATINQGNSGGPIMNQKGNVVGVAVQLIAAEHAQNVFFGVKSSTLKTFAKANNIKFLPPNYREMSNEDLGKLITEATVFLDCWMTVAKIKRIIAQEENRKAFYSEHK